MSKDIEALATTEAEVRYPFKPDWNRAAERNAFCAGAVWAALIIKNNLDSQLNNYLCEMKEGYDDSVVGFNQAWDVVRETFAGYAPLSLPSAEDAELVKRLMASIIDDTRHGETVMDAHQRQRAEAAARITALSASRGIHEA